MFINTIYYFFKNISSFWGPLIPQFWTSADVSPGFQSRVCPSLVCFLIPVCNGFFISISSATPAGLLVASTVVNPFQSTHLKIMCPQALVGFKPMIKHATAQSF